MLNVEVKERVKQYGYLNNGEKKILISSLPRKGMKKQIILLFKEKNKDCFVIQMPIREQVFVCS